MNCPECDGLNLSEIGRCGTCGATVPKSDSGKPEPSTAKGAEAPQMELLPCPFCGGPAKVSNGPYETLLAKCRDGRCAGGLIWVITAMWNQRAPSEPKGTEPDSGEALAELLSETPQREGDFSMNAELDEMRSGETGAERANTVPVPEMALLEQLRRQNAAFVDYLTTTARSLRVMGDRAFADSMEGFVEKCLSENGTSADTAPGTSSPTSGGPREVNVPEMALQWLSIDSAPRDGTDILGAVLHPTEGLCGVDVFSWGDWIEDNGIRYWGWKYESGHLDPRDPTHWLPLPLAPSVPNAPDKNMEEGE